MGCLAARSAAFATKGYFANQRNRRGRQVGRVLASRYEEVAVDRLFDGKTQLTKALQPLVEAAEVTLNLDAAKRVRTIVRLDAGGGSLDDVNWLLQRGYVFHISGFLCSDASGRIVQLVLNQDALLARCLVNSLRKRFVLLHVAVTLDKT